MCVVISGKYPTSPIAGSWIRSKESKVVDHAKKDVKIFLFPLGKKIIRYTEEERSSENTYFLLQNKL